MESKFGATTKTTYSEFEPLCNWQREETRDILVIHLPEFKKEELKVQINNQDILKISGERQVNPTTRTKFYKEITAPKTCITSNIHAKFINGCLYITMPKKNPPSTSTIPEQPIGDQKLAEQVTSKDQSGSSKSSSSSSSSSSSDDDDDDDDDTDIESHEMENEMEKKKKSVSKMKKFAKVAMNLAAVFTVLAGLTAYFIYMYKSVVIED